MFDKFLADIVTDPSAPKEIKVIHDKFCSSLPDLRGIRNSIQHAEDRFKGEQFGKKIDLKKVDESKIGIEGAALVNQGLNSNKFGSTMANGNYGAVDVSAQTLDVLRISLLEVYSAFTSTGPETLYPTEETESFLLLGIPSVHDEACGSSEYHRETRLYVISHYAI